MSTESPWFETWFDSPYYHLLYRERDKDEAKTFLDLLLNRVHLPAESKVMDLACGKGRHSLYLNRQGFNVTGVDLSGENITYCKQFESEKLHFYQHDMRRIFRVNYFDAVFNLFTSFGYFDRDHENEKAIQAAAASLVQGGYFIIDFLNLHLALRELKPFEKKIIDDTTFEITKKIEDGKIIKHIDIENKGIRTSFREEVRILYAEDFYRFFAHSGLKLLETYGDYHLEGFHPESSQRLIFVTRKL
ncbi:MAG: class I SAM-dependent methyltransferase [Bacteroidetes bacterium]|nr:class I SAM-dependent methyltransferase [Bacteroidota bacterium]